MLLGARVEGGKFVVQPRDRIEYKAWGLTAPHNRGMEGLCYADGILVLATELVDERQGKRWAPVATFDVAKGKWTTFWVALSSKTGKLAGVGCRVIDGKVVALAVERHFGVSRLLRFQLPSGPSGPSGPSRIEPEIAADLATVIKPLPNFEGVVWDDDGSVVLLTDNLYKGRSPDPSRLYFVPASVLQ
ncbi:MAG: esterase-like activity of phytase family protein [Myxococcota bacterium]